ncbi:MAG: BON domain-containing protein [Steroidobacteraceae bacterium]
MSTPKQLSARAFAALLLLGAVAGCATYQKCGLQGCPGDAETTAKVRTLLDTHPDLGPPNLLRVQTLDHVVYLTGQVAAELQRDTAESVARQAAGDARVVNSIAIEYGGM